MGAMDWDDSALIAAYDAAVDSYKVVSCLLVYVSTDGDVG